MLPADLYIHFICPSEQLMFRTRESMSPQLRQLDVRYRTDKSYPPECYRFELSIPAVEEYTMTFRVWMISDPRIGADHDGCTQRCRKRFNRDTS